MALTANQTQQLIRQALERFEQLAGSELPPSQVVGPMLQSLADVLQSRSVVAWLHAQKQDGFYPIGQVGQDSKLLFDNQNQPAPPVLQLLTQSWQQSKAVVIGPDQPHFQNTALLQTVQFFVPIEVPGRKMGVLQLINPGELDPKVYRQFVAFAQQAARNLGGYLYRRQSHVVEQNAEQLAAVLEMMRFVGKQNDPQSQVHELANRVRPVLKAHRAAVVSFWSRQPQVVFADVVDANGKAVLVRTVRLLAEAAWQREMPMTFTKRQELPDEDEGLSPLLDDLFSLGNAQAVCLTPIRDEQRIIAMLVVEYDAAEEVGRKAPLQQEIALQVGPFLGQTVQWQQRPLRGVSDALWRVKKRPIPTAIKTLIAVLVLAAVLIGVTMVPVPLHLRTDARLEPESLAAVTTPFSGQVSEVLVTSGDHVDAGQVLARLDDTDLQLELAQVRKAIEQQRVALASARAEGKRADIRAAELAIQRFDIQAQALQRKIAKATIVAPLSGVVLSRRPQDHVGQTVAEGDALLELGDLSQFQLVMDVEEADLSLIQQQLTQNQAVPVTFLSHTWPDLTQSTQIVSLDALSPTSLPQAQKQRHVYHVTVPVTLTGIDGELILANPSGRAKMHVGQGSIMYRYFRRAWQFVRMQLFF